MRFLLDKPKSGKDTFILLIGTLPEGRFIYSTKHKVHPDHWEGQRCKRVKGRNYDDTNELLNNIDNLVKDLKRTGQLFKSKLIEELDSLTGRIRRSNNTFEIIDEIIADREFGRVLTPKNMVFSKETIKGYRHTRDNLYKFDTHLSFDSFSEDRYNKLLEFFNQKNHSVNAIGKTVKNLKVFMQAAYDKGLHKNRNFSEKWFKTPSENTPDVFLNEKELIKIATHTLHNRGQQIARDWYIIGSFTGLRISDLQVLNEDKLQGDFITIANEKTDVKVVIPIHPLVKSVLKRWKGFPPKISDQELNREIKKVAELAGLKEKFLYSITKGGRRVDEYVPKYQMVSTHTMRRSFITNLLRFGVQDNKAMELAGIKKHTTLMKYKKSTPEETAREMSSHPFFSGKQSLNPRRNQNNDKPKRTKN